MRNYISYTDEDIIKYAKEVKSVASLLRKLGLVARGSNYKTMYKAFQRLNIDTSHWTCQAWNKGNQHKNWEDYRSSTQLRTILLKERSAICQNCNKIEWEGRPIPLEVHHVDGDNTNNKKENLRLLCCNCHALTSNWRSRNIVKEGFCRCGEELGENIAKCNKCYKNLNISRKNKKCKDCDTLIHPRNMRCIICSRAYQKRKRDVKNNCLDCYKSISPKATRCKSCAVVVQQSNTSRRPTKEQLFLDKQELKNYCAIGRKYGVSDNAVRKWEKYYAKTN